MSPEAVAGMTVFPAPTRSPWLISAREDLVWFHGSVLAGVALLAFFVRGAPTHVAIGLVLWGVFFDGTHVLGTFTHSRAHAAVGQRGWLFVLLGPAIALVDFAACTPGPSQLGQAGWLFRTFLLGAYVWAYFHLVRQHYGFVALYRRQARATDWVERRLETILLWVGCLYPYLRFSLSPAYAQSGLPVLLPDAWLPALRLGLDVGAGALGVGLVAALLQRNRGQVGPRHLLIATVIAFHLAVFALLDNLLVITAALTVFHNLQYHRIVWDHAKREGRQPANGLGRYLMLGIALGAIWYLPRFVGVALGTPALARNLLLGAGWGVVMVHYYVDGKIWRRPA